MDYKANIYQDVDQIIVDIYDNKKRIVVDTERRVLRTDLDLEKFREAIEELLSVHEIQDFDWNFFEYLCDGILNPVKESEFYIPPTL